MPESDLHFQVDRAPGGQFVKGHPAIPAARKGAETMRRAPPRHCSTAKPRR